MTRCPRQDQPLDRCAALGDRDSMVNGACVTCGVRPRKIFVIEVRRFDCCGACKAPGDCAENKRCRLGLTDDERAVCAQEEVA